MLKWVRLDGRILALDQIVEVQFLPNGNSKVFTTAVDSTRDGKVLAHAVLIDADETEVLIDAFRDAHIGRRRIWGDV